MGYRIPLLVTAALVVAYLAGVGFGAPSGQHGALPDEPVLVVVVKSHEDIAAVRAVVDPERIVANNEALLALQLLE